MPWLILIGESYRHVASSIVVSLATYSQLAPHSLLCFQLYHSQKFSEREFVQKIDYLFI